MSNPNLWSLAIELAAKAKAEANPEALKRIIQQARDDPEFLQLLVQQAQANPLNTAAVAGGAVLIIASVGIPLGLGAAGFSAAGPVAGTSAAAWQATMGSVPAGSLFALCQSASMGGTIAAIFPATGVAGAGAIVAGSMGKLRGMLGI